MWTSEVYSYGYPLAAVLAWLVWRRRDELLAGDATGTHFLLPMVIFAAAWMLATVGNVRAIHQAALPGVLVCWGIATFGTRSARILAPIGATFLLAVPLWSVLIPVLRRFTIAFSGVFLWILRIPAEIEGDLIAVTSGTFRIAEGCAGLRFLLAGLVIGALYAHVMLKGRVSRASLAVVGLAAFFAMLANWIRVTALIVIGHLSEMQSSLVEQHLSFGWIVFALALVPFFLAAGRVERRLGRQVAAASPEDGPAPGGERSGSTPRRAALATGLAVAAPVFYLAVGALPTRDPEPGVMANFAPAAAWSEVGSQGRPYSWSPDFHGAERHLERGFAADGSTVWVDRMLYGDQGHGAELINYLNRIAPDSVLVRERVFRLPGRSSRWVRAAIVRPPETPVLVWYWYRVAGVDTTSGTRAKLLELIAFLTRSSGAELVAVSAPCSGESCAAASEALSAFLGAPEPR